MAILAHTEKRSTILVAPVVGTGFVYFASTLAEEQIQSSAAGARAAIDEAISIRRQLAKASPARYQAGFEQSLQQLAQIEAASHHGGPMVSVVNSAR